MFPKPPSYPTITWHATYSMPKAGTRRLGGQSEKQRNPDDEADREGRDRNGGVVTVEFPNRNETADKLPSTLSHSTHTHTKIPYIYIYL